jgi:hypothetical protein
MLKNYKLNFATSRSNFKFFLLTSAKMRCTKWIEVLVLILGKHLHEYHVEENCFFEKIFIVSQLRKEH